MAANRTTQITALRRAVDCLPERTRRAMLAGIDNNTIVVGAYAMDDGVCPMLAAHRAGGRTNFVAFARAWDEYCFRGVRKRRRRPRLATSSELSALRAHIESSLLAEEDVDLRGALIEHRGLRAARAAVELEALARNRPPAASVESSVPVTDVPKPARRDRVRPGDPDRSGEFTHRHGWRWMRIMRSYDEYEQAMASLAESGVSADDSGGEATIHAGPPAPDAERELAVSRD